MTGERDAEAFEAFIDEARAHLATLEQTFLDLEAGRATATGEVVNQLFRAAHTIKGTAGFFGLEPVTELAHAMEDLLGLVRDGSLVCTAAQVKVLISATDVLAAMLHDLDSVDAVDPRPAVAALRRSMEEGWLDSVGTQPAPGAPAAAPAPLPDPGPASDRAPGPALPAPEPAVTAAPSVELDRPAPAAPADDGGGGPASPLPPEDDRPAFAARADDAAADAPAARAGRKGEGGSSIRVNLGQLDRLMLLAGELVLTRNALLKKAAERDLDQMISLTERVDAITSDLQEGVMATRMQPVGLVFSRFRRVVRDLALQLGKKIELEVSGEEVELDKTMIEAIGDPLAHLVRNAADHGVESAAARRAAGKPEAGKLALRAFHEAGQVVIQVTDDGAGIDPEKIAAAALKKGLHTAEQLRAMSDDEKRRLIFAPGFSTAAQVTGISGRGVGMDVVHSSLTAVGGTVEIRSEVGRGTTIAVRLPLTLAIIPSVLVTVNEERFAIPQANLVELVRVPAAEVQRRVERVGSAAVMRLRGELLPLVRLSSVLGVEPVWRDPETGERRPDRREAGIDRRSPDPVRPPTEEELARRSGAERRKSRDSAVNVVVVAAGGLRYGLIVQQFLDSEEIVVKPLGRHLAGNQEYAGATILGDGAVALILDVAGLAVAANLGTAQKLIEAVVAQRRETLARDAQSMLVVENGPGELFAIPLGLVSRIERIQADQAVSVGGRTTVTRGDQLLPLLAIEDVARVTPRQPAKRFFGVVCSTLQREFALAVSRIVDVVDSLAPVDGATHLQPGILGSMVVDGGVVLLLDVLGIVGALLPEYRNPPKAVAPAAGEAPPVVLVVEDSPFFRKQMVSALEEAGYQTLAAGDGEEGLSLLEGNSGRVGLVITDIEMPRLDGLAMTRRIRGNPGHRGLPVLAVTSLSGEAAEREGREAGLSEYLIKLDREQIVERTRHYLDRRLSAGANP